MYQICVKDDDYDEVTCLYSLEILFNLEKYYKDDNLSIQSRYIAFFCYILVKSNFHNNSLSKLLNYNKKLTVFIFYVLNRYVPSTEIVSEFTILHLDLLQHIKKQYIEKI